MFKYLSKVLVSKKFKKMLKNSNSSAAPRVSNSAEKLRVSFKERRKYTNLIDYVKENLHRRVYLFRAFTPILAINN
jgi:hypothetical protein